MNPDPNAFNLGHGYSVAFAQPPRLMAQNIRVLVRESEGVLICAVERDRSLLVSGKAFAVQWLRDGKPIPGETGRAYTKRPEDKGHVLSCIVTDAMAIESEKFSV
jgi:hypothetical protein